MELLLGLFGGEILSYFIIFFLFVRTGNFIESALGTIITWIFYIFFGVTALCGLYKIKEHIYKREIIAGILVFLFGAAGIFSIADAEGINDYIKQKTVEKEEKLLAKSDCFLSFENLCNTEEIIKIEIKYTYDKKHDRYITGKKGEWQHVYPSKGKVHTLEKIPYTKPGYLFTARIATKNNVKEPVKIHYDDYYFYNIIYFEKAEIDVQDEKTVHFSYNGSKLLLDDSTAKNDKPYFSYKNTIIRYNIFSDEKQYLSVHIKTEEDVERGYGNYHSFSTDNKAFALGLLSENKGLPNNVDIFHLESGKKYFAVYSKAGFETETKEFIAGENNYIEIRDDKVYITEKPLSLKFEFIK